MSLADEKNRLRAAARKARARLARVPGDAPGRALAHLIDDPRVAALPVTTAVSAYLPFGDEFDCLPCLAHFADRGHRTALPVVIAKAQPLEFRAWRPGEPLAPGVWDIPVPPADRAVVEPGLVLVPLLAFDAEGHRLGYGGGFYDRTLARLRAARADTLAFGIAFAGQAVAAVPCAAFDARLDAVVTEAGLIRMT